MEAQETSLESLLGASLSSTTSLTWETPIREVLTNIFKEKRPLPLLLVQSTGGFKVSYGEGKKCKVFKNIEKVIH